MIKFFDSFLLKSCMPKEELCIIGRAKRAFYYYGIAALSVTGVSFLFLDFVTIFG